MSAYLSTEWLEAPFDPVAESFARSGGAARVGRIVTKAPDGEARYTAVVADGAVVYEAGTDDVEVTFTDTYPNAVAQLEGDLDPNAAFMSGKTKVTGPTSVLLAVLAAAKGPTWDELRAQAASTLR